MKTTCCTFLYCRVRRHQRISFSIRINAISDDAIDDVMDDVTWLRPFGGEAKSATSSSSVYCTKLSLKLLTAVYH